MMKTGLKELKTLHSNNLSFMKQLDKQNRNRIIKNTLFLYLRMILVMVVSFFTARVTLQVLGVEDFGIQNVVAGIVSFLGIMTSTMTSATQRFFAYDLGRNDLHQYRRTFSTIIAVFLLLSVIVLIVGEVLGPWLIKDYLVIPHKRLYAAYWTYQFAILTFIASMMTIPFSSSCIAYERMDVFGYISIVESLFKLSVVYLLCLSSFDKLITFSLLNCIVQYLLLGIYIVFCVKKFKGCHLSSKIQPQLLKQILSYTGWNLFGSISGVLCTSGLTILLNIFFGPVVNAAKSIADKINQVVNQFSNNFFQASAPQIVKSYASGDTSYSLKIVYKCSKFSYYLIFVITIAIVFVIRDLLDLWLGEEYVTEDMVSFTKWILVYSLVNVLEPAISQIIRATGNIKKYQVSVGVITLLCLPLCYVLFRLKFSPEWSLITLTIIYIIALFVRLHIAEKQVGLKVSKYIGEVLLPILAVSIFTSLIMFAISTILGSSKLRIIYIPSLSIIVSVIIIYMIGITKEEKTILRQKIKLMINKFFKN